jgi:hypothetical protein
MEAAEIPEVQRRVTERGIVSIWTVYERHKDYPRGYMARRFEVHRDCDAPVVTDDIVRDKLFIIRACLNFAGLTRVPRMDGDDPVILECWL